MSWDYAINPASPVWAVGVIGYCDQRITELTALCVNPESTDLQIRQAQKAIEELQRLKSLPDTLRATAEISRNTNKRGEY